MKVPKYAFLSDYDYEKFLKSVRKIEKYSKELAEELKQKLHLLYEYLGYHHVLVLIDTTLKIKDEDMNIWTKTLDLVIKLVENKQGIGASYCRVALEYLDYNGPVYLNSIKNYLEKKLNE